MARQTAIALSVALLMFGSLVSTDTVCAATLTAADVSPAEVTQVTQAASASVAIVTAFGTTRTDQARVSRQEIAAQLAAIQTYFQEVKQYLDSRKTEIATKAEFTSARADFDAALRATTDSINRNKEAIDAAKSASETQFESALEAASTQMALSTVKIDSSAASEFAALNAAMAAAKAKRQQIEDQIEQIDREIAAVKEEIDKLERMLEKITDLKEKITAFIAKKETLLKGMEAAAADAADAARAASCFTRISQDRSYAAAILAAVRNNLANPAGLGKALKTLTLTDVDVREVRETTGLIATFRIGRLTHCFSTVLQCGGKAYTVSAP